MQDRGAAREPCEIRRDYPPARRLPRLLRVRILLLWRTSEAMADSCYLSEVWIISTPAHTRRPALLGVPRPSASTRASDTPCC